MAQEERPQPRDDAEQGKGKQEREHWSIPSVRSRGVTAAVQRIQIVGCWGSSSPMIVGGGGPASGSRAFRAYQIRDTTPGSQSGSGSGAPAIIWSALRR